MPFHLFLGWPIFLPTWDERGARFALEPSPPLEKRRTKHPNATRPHQILFVQFAVELPRDPPSGDLQSVQLIEHTKTCPPTTESPPSIREETGHFLALFIERDVTTEQDVERRKFARVDIKNMGLSICIAEEGQSRRRKMSHASSHEA
ncbi:hypothetical protein APHAL10511_004631 [Amanita phalloides]|nr:hypothetical protein APHAL10511_004631 [Amanita phalloides]